MQGLTSRECHSRYRSSVGQVIGRKGDDSRNLGGQTMKRPQRTFPLLWLAGPDFNDTVRSLAVSLPP